MAVKPQETYGLTHLAILVRNVNRTVEFYKQVFDAHVMYQEPTWAQITTPESNDIIVFEQSDNENIGRPGGIIHFGFRLKEPDYIHEMVRRITSAGGKIREQGEFVPGSPYVFFFDPDGYEIEVWYEKLPG